MIHLFKLRAKIRGHALNFFQSINCYGNLISIAVAYYCQNKISFQVVNAGRSGQQLDISVKIRSPTGKLVQYINRKVEDQLLKYSALEDGDYEICFNNRYSMLEVKKVFWQFEVEGAFDEVAAHEKLVNATVDYFKESSKEVEAVVRKVM